MKKLIAISVMLVLLTGAVFAQVSGTVQTRLNVMQSGDLGNLETNPLMIGGDIGAAHIQLAGANADGTLGGLFRFRNVDTVRRQEEVGHWSNGGGAWFHRVFVWWRPMPELRVWLGIDQDGMFDTAALAGWAFHQGDNDYMFVHDWGFWRTVFPGNWDGYGMALTYQGIEGVALNLVVPTGNLNWPQANARQVRATSTLEDMLGKLQFQSSIAVPDLGTVFITYAGPGSSFDNAANYGRLGASFLLSGAVDGLQLQVGGSFVIPGTADGSFAAGLAAHYNMEGISIRARAGMTMSLADNADPFITANVMPVFTLDGMTAFLDIGLALQSGEIGWWVTPALRVPMTGGMFAVGVTVRSGIENNGGISIFNDAGVFRGDNIYFNIPMLLQFSF
jgi:hypothetical protein